MNLGCLLAYELVSVSAKVPAVHQHLLDVCHVGFVDLFALLCVFTVTILQNLRIFLFP